jgi:hypothetical protein
LRVKYGVVLLLFFSACTRRRAFSYGAIASPRLTFTRVEKEGGPLDRQTFRDPGEDLEIHVSRPQKLAPGTLASVVEAKMRAFDAHFADRGFTIATGDQIHVPLCDPSLAPRRPWREDLRAGRTAFANARYTLPACRPEEVAFRASYVVLACESSAEVFEVRLYSRKRGDLDELARSLRCR